MQKDEEMLSLGGNISLGGDFCIEDLLNALEAADKIEDPALRYGLLKAIAPFFEVPYSVLGHLSATYLESKSQSEDALGHDSLTQKG
jgi:hypothetical protein